MLLRELAAILRSDLSLVVSDMERDLLVNSFHVPPPKVKTQQTLFGFEAPVAFKAAGA